MTSIEWLADMISKMGYVSADIVEQARARHREEIQETWEMGRFNIDAIGSGEEYYNETFKQLKP